MEQCRTGSQVDETEPVVERRRLATRAFRALRAHWILEVVVLVGLFAAYNLIRATQGKDAGAAVAHSRWILELEGRVFDYVEVPLNSWMGTVPVVAVAACYFYALMHYVMTPAVLLLSRRHGGWLYWRGYWAIVLASAIALAVYAAWPVAPPRLVPDLGIADVMRDHADYGWWGSAASAPRGIGDATNQYAAMPSLHFGWSLWCGIQIWALSGRAWRLLAVAYPALQVLVVVATGNHFLLDVVGGAAVVVVAYLAVGLARPLAQPRPRHVTVGRGPSSPRRRHAVGCVTAPP
jgi:hypothetical protein